MLKFTEQLTSPSAKKIFTDVALNELRELVNKKEEPSLIEDPELTKENVNIYTKQPVYQEQPELDITRPAVVQKVNISGVKKQNLFSLPSIITVLFFVVSTIYVDYDAALEDGRISRRERLKLFYLLLGAVATLVSRGSEGKSAPTVPDWMPGPHKRDYDGNGVIDEEDYKIYLNSKPKD